MSKIEVDQVDPQSGTNLTLGTSGDSILIPSGVTLANSGTMTGVPAPTSGIAASAIDSGTIATARLGSGTASSSTFLRGDQTYADPGGGISVAHQWRVTTTFQGTATPVASNWEQADTDGYGGIGTAMSESSGVFTFPSTGVYLVQANVTVYYGGNLRYWRVNIQSTTDNSSYADAAAAYSNMNQVSSNWYSSAEAKFMFDVTNTSTHKIRMAVTPENESAYFAGATDQNLLYFTFIRLGDT